MALFVPGLSLCGKTAFSCYYKRNDPVWIFVLLLMSTFIFLSSTLFMLVAWTKIKARNIEVVKFCRIVCFLGFLETFFSKYCFSWRSKKSNLLYRHWTLLHCGTSTPTAHATSPVRKTQLSALNNFSRNLLHLSNRSEWIIIGRNGLRVSLYLFSIDVVWHRIWKNKKAEEDLKKRKKTSKKKNFFTAIPHQNME